MKCHVSDAYNNRGQVFDTDGRWLQSIGGLGLWGGRFRVAAGISVARDGSLFVDDFYNNRIQRFPALGACRTYGKSTARQGSGPKYPDFPLHGYHHAPQNHAILTSLPHLLATIPLSPTGS